MNSEEILKVVFPLLEDTDLASCMLVCKQWRDAARDDYLWKLLCVKRWPSISKRVQPPALSFHELYQTVNKRRVLQPLFPPSLSLDCLDFHIDIWTEENLVFSEVVSGTVLKTGLKITPDDISDLLMLHLGKPYKIILSVEPRINLPLGKTVSVSVLAEHKDSNKVVCIIDKAQIDYIDALPFSYLDFPPTYPFISGIKGWISLLFMDYGNKEVVNVLGIEMDFSGAADTEKVSWLLDTLDWK